jgi:hypothetical protein
LPPLSFWCLALFLFLPFFPSVVCMLRFYFGCILFRFATCK